MWWTHRINTRWLGRTKAVGMKKKPSGGYGSFGPINLWAMEGESGKIQNNCIIGRWKDKKFVSEEGMIV